MKIKESYIILRNLSFRANHGVNPQEQIVGNEFYIDLRLKVNIEEPASSDDLANTVSYADVYQSVKSEMDEISKLLEHVGARICKRLLHDFPLIEEVELKINKRNPPMGADVESACVELVCSR